MKVRAIASRRKDVRQIAAEWDAAADRRHEQIESRRDLSFWHVLSPAILELLQGCDTKRLVDIGCGTGELTQQVARVARDVLGLDVSARSVQIAQDQNRALPNVNFAVGP